MKSIIQGKIYNTETAEEVGSGDNSCSQGDCWRQTVELYRTPRGNYFIYTANGRILPLDDQFKTRTGGPYEYEVVSIFEWIAEWNITNLKQREIDLFGITEA